jgi:hypothetical protein
VISGSANVSFRWHKPRIRQFLQTSSYLWDTTPSSDRVSGGVDCATPCHARESST